MVDRNVSIDHFEFECQWTDIGFIDRQGNGHKLKLPEGLPKQPGVYQIFAINVPLNMSQIYVGEGKDLSKRLKDYENAGYMPNRYARTNRRVQGWIFNCIDSGHPVTISICTSAKINQPGKDLKALQLADKHSRTLVESFVRASKDDLRFENKWDSWKTRKFKVGFEFL